MTYTEKYEELYNKYLKEGYFSQWANQKALNELAGICSVLKPTSQENAQMVMIPGVGYCAYTGD